MIKTIKVENFKNHQSTEINFDDSRLHALVGQNGTGKTSLLQAILILSDSLSMSETDATPFRTEGESKLSIFAEGYWQTPEKKWDWGFILRKSDKAEENSDVGLQSLPEYALASASLENAPLFQFTATNLAKPTFSDDLIPQITADGYGLATFIDYLRGEFPEKFQELQTLLQQIVSSFKGIGLKRVRIKRIRKRVIEVNGKTLPYEEEEEVVGHQLIFAMSTGNSISAEAVSEGTLLALGLLTVLNSPHCPNLVLIDDVEKGLHPKPQRELVSILKQLIQKNPDLQIIFSTHSPYIIDELEPSQVHLFNNELGFTKVKRLDEHPDAEWASQMLTTAEFWGAEGESWVVEERING